MNAKRFLKWLFCGTCASALVTPLWAADWFPIDPLGVRPPVLLNPLHGLKDQTDLDCTQPFQAGTPLALGEAIDLALCQNPQLKEAWAAIKQQSAQWGQAQGAFLPTINVNQTRQNSRVSYPAFAGSNTSTLGDTQYASFNLRLLDFGGRDANSESARFLLNSAIWAHEAQIQKTATHVIETYFDALSAQASQVAKGQIVQYARQTFEASLRKENKGAAARADSLQANTALAKAELGAQRAHGDYQKAMSALAYTLGIDLHSPFALVDVEQSPQPDHFDLKDLNDWFAAAKENHPAIIAAQAKVLSAEQKIKAATSDGLPSLDFFSNYYQNGFPNQAIQTNQSNTISTGIVLNIPLFEGFTRTYKIREAQAMLEQAQAQLEDVRHQTLADIVNAHADAVASLANLQSSERLIQAAQEALVSSQRRYDKNASDILELLNAQSNLADAQQERIRYLAEWHSARLRLLSTSGTLTQDRFKLN